MEASCWVAKKIFLSAARASSRARTLDSRPTTNGVIMKGKMTTSRMGIIGSFLLSNFSLDVVTESPLGLSDYQRSLAVSCQHPAGMQHGCISFYITSSSACLLLNHCEGGTAFVHHLPRDFELFELLLAGQVE